MTLLDKLVNDAVISIDAIIDPIEKVRAISSILPFIDKKAKAPDIAEVEQEIHQQVKEEVKKQSKKLKEEEKTDKPIEAPKKETPIQEEPQKEEPKNEPAVSVSGDMDAIVKKFGKEKLRDFLQDQDKIELLSEPFARVEEFKTRIKEFMTKSGLDIEPEAMLKYYMSQVDEENPELIEDSLAMTVEQFIDSFIPFMESLYTIYGYSKNEIESTLKEMSNGTRTNMSDITFANAEALAMVLQHS